MTDPRNMQEPEDNATELVSPELVLVDPQLAARARERLGGAGEGLAFAKRVVEPARHRARDSRPAEHRPAPRAPKDDSAQRSARDGLAATREVPELDENGKGSTPAVSGAQFEAGAASLEDAKVDTSFVRGRRRGRRAVVAVGAVLAAVIGVLVFPLDVIDSGGSKRDTTLIPPRTPSIGPVKQTHRNGRVSERSQARTRTAPLHSTKPAIQSKKRLRPARPTRFPTRVFVWPAVSRATFYKVEFFRRGRKVFEASPRKPRIELPLRWVFRGRHQRLTHATYRWNVRPAFGSRARPRFGKLITRSTWVAR
jgi:hypothetical protein